MREESREQRVKDLFLRLRRAKEALAEAQHQLRRALSSGAREPIKMWEKRVRSEEYSVVTTTQLARESKPADCLGHCWSCDRWSKIRFEYTEGLSGPSAKHVYVHISSDAWAPRKMKL